MQAAKAAATPPKGHKGHKGIGMEGLVANWYARQTAKDLEEFASTARRLSARIKPGARVLEIAPGPGYLAIEVARLTGADTFGLDISRTFVRLAGENARKAGVAVAFERGDAADLPFASCSFDFVFCRAAFKNFSRPLEALNEMHRVLKPGCGGVVIDLRKDFSPRDIDDYVRGKGVLNAALIKLVFNTMLKKRAYSRDAIAQLASQSAFRQGDVYLSAVGFELWLRKCP